jgi:hypothetical protein
LRKFTDRNYVGVSAGAYPWVPIEHHGDYFSLSYHVIHGGNVEVSGSKVVSANLEGTLDDVFTVASCKPFFLVTANQTSGAIDGFFTQPLVAVRLKYNTVTVSGSLLSTFQLLRAG